MPNAILDPTGRTGSPPAPSVEPAPRRADLSGARIGVLENTKQNAQLLLTEIARSLTDEHGAAGVVLLRTKRAFAQPVGPELIEEYANTCDVVITGVGDCGSCSASAVADGMLFEKAGLPAAVICSDAFTATATAMAEMRGEPGYAYLTTAHPVAVLSAQQVRERAESLVGDVVRLLTAAGS